MSGSSLMPFNEVFIKGVPRQLTLIYEITGAVTVAARPLAGASASLPLFAASTQAAIDAFLGTSSEFDYLAFDATSMGADAMGLIINMKGQAADVVGFEATCYSGSGLTTAVTRTALKSTTLTNTSLATEIAVGADGNIALKIDWGNTPDFDALTAGKINVVIQWISK